MLRFPAGMVLLLIVSVLIYFGLAHRVLDRMRMNDRTALTLILGILVGSFIDIPIGSRITVNLGGIVAVGVAIYVIVGAGTAKEKTRALIAAAVTALALYLGGRLLGAEPENMLIDPVYFYPLVAGIVGYLAGRSRRGAFFSAVMGVFVLDVIQFIFLLRSGVPGRVYLGGGGAFDSLVMSGILAVLLAEVIGETRERLQGGPKTEGRNPELLRNLREPEPASKPMPEGGDQHHEK
ncbi:MAG: DUF1614 domain-containing protein [Methylocystaceae bacterium]